MKIVYKLISILPRKLAAKLYPLVRPKLMGHKTDFLDRGTGNREMNKLGTDFNGFKDSLERLQRRGYDTAYLYWWNYRDGGPATIPWDNNEYFGRWNKKWVEETDKKMKEAMKRGMAIVWWITPDDDGKLYRAMQSNIAGFMDSIDFVMDRWGHMFSGVVICLEVEEAGHAHGALKAAVNRLRGHGLKGNIGVHSVPNKYTAALHFDCDWMFYQFGFRQSKSSLVNECQTVAAKVHGQGKRFCASEYDANDRHSEQIGEALLKAGADAFGNG